MYPNDGVLLPPNLRLLEVHFLPGANNTLFEIAFENALTDVKVYTRCTLPMNGGCIYTPDATRVDMDRGHQPRRRRRHRARARGTDDAGTGVGTSSDITHRVQLRGRSRAASTTGRRRAARPATRRSCASTSATSTQTTAERFVGPEQAGGKCVGCHALSRDGKKMVAAAGGWDVEDSLLVDVGDRDPHRDAREGRVRVVEPRRHEVRRRVRVHRHADATT